MIPESQFGRKVFSALIQPSRMIFWILNSVQGRAIVTIHLGLLKSSIRDRE
jgi:hypothetical protein